MRRLRTFIAVDLPSHIQQSIQQKIEPLRKTLGASSVRWVSIQSTHLTLKFLGDVSASDIDALTRMLSTEADQVPAFDIQIGRLGSFPSPRRPRTLFIGIQAPAELEALYRGIESACTCLGYEAESRRFRPHLTLGRIRRETSRTDQQKIHRALEEIKIDSLASARVDLVHLYKSDLKPTGSVYTKLFSAPLHK